LDGVNAEIAAGHLPGFDWHKYDQNGDGIIDRLFIVHAGYGEEENLTLLNRTLGNGGYGEGAIWSHSSAIATYSVTTDIAASPYIIMPENGGIGVFAHEFGHNIGADDLYSYGDAEASSGFWTLMSDDWTGYPIGFQPPSLDPLHLDGFGWLNPIVISDTSQVYDFYLGQTSEFPVSQAKGMDLYRGARIELPDQNIPLPAPIWQGSYYWWGGAENLANGRMTTKNPIAIPSGTVTPTLTFDLAYDLEQGWDFMWVQVSENKTTWHTLTNANTTCEHDPSWIGENYGFPADMCAAGVGGFTGYNADFPAPQAQTFDLGAYKGKSVYLRFWYMTDWGTVYSGPFVDVVKVQQGTTELFSDNAENGDGKWDYVSPWVRSDGKLMYSHNFYLQWRNTNANGGFDSSLGDPRFRYGPANTGMLVWYNDSRYTDNNIFSSLTGLSTLNDYPGFGPKGMELVVDANPYPYRDPVVLDRYYPNEAANVPSRSLMRDATFHLENSVDFTMKPPATVNDPQAFKGRPAVSVFHDALGYYPGMEFTPGSALQTNRWMTAQWDASVVMPAKAHYGLKAPGYTNGTRARFFCSIDAGSGQVLCYGYAAGLGYDGGTGNPGDTNVQYGWHVQVLDEAADHTWAHVRVWNSAQSVDTQISRSTATVLAGDVVKYQVDFRNTGSPTGFFACVGFDPSKMQVVPGSGSSNMYYLPTCGGITAKSEADLKAQALSTKDLALAKGLGVFVDNVVTGSNVHMNVSMEALADGAVLGGPGLAQVTTKDGKELYTPVTTSLISTNVFMPLVNK